MQDLPAPLRPVTTTSLPTGMSTSNPFKLFWRTPRRRMASGRGADIGPSIGHDSARLANLLAHSAANHALRGDDRLNFNIMRFVAEARD